MKILLIILTFSTFLASCGKEQEGMSISSNKSKFILGAFSDVTSPLTLDLSQLQDLPKSVHTSDGSDILITITAQNDYGSILEEDCSYQPSWFTKGLIQKIQMSREG